MTAGKKCFAAIALLAFLFAPAHNLMACSVCYGAPDSGMAKGLVWGIAALYWRSEGQPGKESGEFEGIALLMGFMGSGFVGYWLFARPVMAGYGTESTYWAVALTTAWLVLPLVWVWKRWKRRKAQLAPAALPRAKVVAR